MEHSEGLELLGWWCEEPDEFLIFKETLITLVKII